MQSEDNQGSGHLRSTLTVRTAAIPAGGKPRIVSEGAAVDVAGDAPGVVGADEAGRSAFPRAPSRSKKCARRSCYGMARRSLRRILPTADLGSASRKRICFGTLYAASW